MTDAAIRGHVFCSLLSKELFDRFAARRHGDLEWQHIVDDLDYLSESRSSRTPAAPACERLQAVDPICRALGITLPHIFQEIAPKPEPV
jgi:hypothetical protein